MTLALFYDTETQGLPDFSAPSEASHQPHIVQLAALLIDLNTRATIASMDVIVRPDGWSISDEVAAIHGITTERAMDVGIPETLAVDMFMGLWSGRVRIAHNESFDARILRIAMKRHVDPRDHGQVIPPSDDWKAGRAECTARLATPACAIPPTAKMLAARRNHFKTPNLREAYMHFTGRELVGAHSAMADVLACRDVYFALKGEAVAA